FTLPLRQQLPTPPSSPPPPPPNPNTPKTLPGQATMANFFTATSHPALGPNFIKLSAAATPATYEPWCAAFVDIVNTTDYAKYYTDKYEPMAKPKLPPYTDAAYQRWNSQVWARKAALSLLRSAVEDAVWQGLKEEEKTDPGNAWVAIHARYGLGLSDDSSMSEDCSMSEDSSPDR
ncbi:hypothetical protein IQ07DRAFT_653078, partial [Pyrenochaeta sp. DS3sAY3a]